MGMSRPKSELPAGSVALLGIPFDVGTHPLRVGSRQGPQAIREASRSLRRYMADLQGRSIDGLNIFDCGDVRLKLGDTVECFDRIQAALAPVAQSGVTPVTMGGDGAVTLPQLRAARGVYTDLAVLHFDAHTDAYPGTGQDAYTNATTFTRAAEEGLIDVESTMHIGARGTTYLDGAVSEAQNLGYHVIAGDELLDCGVAEIADRILARLDGKSVYLCWDMDIFDPSTAPGVATPEWGGISANQGIQLIRMLSALNIKWFDINTVSPPHDVSGLTSSLASRMILEFLYVHANSKSPSR